jgi:hypothetical protein
MTDTWLSYSPNPMDPTLGSPSDEHSARAYSRAEVDDFLAAAAAERIRLEAEIAEATERISRARAAIGMHRVMVSMLFETQREVSALRREADAQARQIVADAEREVAAMVRASSPLTAQTGSTFAADASRIPPSPPAADGHTIDLQLAEPHGNGAQPVAPPAAEPLLASTSSFAESPTSDDEYFDFLRGALAEDDGPFGPDA